MKLVFKISFQLLLRTERKRYENKVARTLTNRSAAPVEERREEPSVAPLSPISFSEEQINRIFARTGSPDGTSEDISHGEKVEHATTNTSVGAAEYFKEKRRVIPLSPTSERLIRETRFSAEQINEAFAKARGLDAPIDEKSP